MKVRALFFLSLGIFLMPSLLQACSVCFGNPDSLQSKALSGAILFLMATIGAVLGGIAVLAVIWSRRAKQLENSASKNRLSSLAASS